MNNYNAHLYGLRTEANLSLKAAAKGIGISRIKLYFFENGYFRPSKKDLKKINDFYKSDVSLKGDNAYPAPTADKVITTDKKDYKKKRIVFGALSFFFLIPIITGAVLFKSSTNNKRGFYGPTYNAVHDKVKQFGDIGHDLVTGLQYHYLSDDNSESTVVFYETTNILYFNECSYSKTLLSSDFQLNRIRFHFGSNLGVSSYNCTFTYGGLSEGTFYSCNFKYEGKPVTKATNFKHIIDGSKVATKEDAIACINAHLENAEASLSALMSKSLLTEISFYKDFLKDREHGRLVNAGLQITGLILLYSGIIAFFIIFAIFLNLMLMNIKPRLVSSRPQAYANRTKAPLPKDINMPVGIPDFIVVILARVMRYFGIAYLVLALVGKTGIPFLNLLGNANVLSAMKVVILMGVFLEQFVMIGRIKKPSTLFYEIIYYLGVFLLIATLETVSISITNEWGYNLAPLVFKYLPGNIYQVVAIQYVIFLFLFFQPSFLPMENKRVRIIWHSLAIIPFAFLVTSHILSNRYNLVYGVKQNIFTNIWFPNGTLSLSIVVTLFMLLTFVGRLFVEQKYGQHKGQLYFYSDRYTILENLICVGLILVAALIDLAFMNSQYGYYLGLGSNAWMFILIPVIALCKYSPNNQQVFVIDKDFRRQKRY